ncbi:MAG: 4Fe-4S dicluster domain-containing protein [Desulfosalsimonadaceae bacterium]
MIFRELQRHLDTMPVGFPATRSGVEIRILKHLFAPDEARLAMALTHRPETVQTIAERVPVKSIPMQDIHPMLNHMASKGSILRKTLGGNDQYALAPFVVGMFEFQLAHMTPALYADTARYFREAFGLAYLSTAVPQMRVIPIEKSLTPEKNTIATYDRIRHIIENTNGKIGVADCICRKGKDLIGEPCKKTDRRNLCFGFRDYFETYKREGWFREVGKDEALEILMQSEADGLVLQTTNEQEPQAVCACCGCCCGVLATLKEIPNPADFAATNFYAAVDAGQCVGCGLCEKRCHMEAIRIFDKQAEINLKRCIGCGVCVPACKPGAISLIRKKQECVPPKTTEDLYETIRAGKNRWTTLTTVLKILRHMNWREIKALLDKR